MSWCLHWILWDYPALPLEVSLHLCLHHPHQAGQTFLCQPWGGTEWWARGSSAVHHWRTHHHCWSTDHQSFHRSSSPWYSCQSLQWGGASSLLGWSPRVLPCCFPGWGVPHYHSDRRLISPTPHVGQNCLAQSMASCQVQWSDTEEGPVCLRHSPALALLSLQAYSACHAGGSWWEQYRSPIWLPNHSDHPSAGYQCEWRA